MNTKQQNILTQEDINLNTIKVLVLIPLAQEVQTEPWFIIHQLKLTIQISPMIWFISLILEDNIWMGQLMLQELFILESLQKNKEILTQEFCLEI